jgi:hypothetical protein
MLDFVTQLADLVAMLLFSFVELFLQLGNLLITLSEQTFLLSDLHFQTLDLGL